MADSDAAASSASASASASASVPAPMPAPVPALTPVASLPVGWKQEFSRSQQKTYYFHAGTGASVWSLAEVHSSESTNKNNSNNNNDDKKKRPAVELGDDDAESSSSSKRTKAGEAKSNEAKKSSASGLSKVAVIVPFRDLHSAQQRQAHLRAFVPHMERFLGGIGGVASFHIFVVEQSADGRKFNRGKLLNIGFAEALKKDAGFDSFVFHDVDLLPQPVLAPWYARLPRNPVHIARCWGRYNNNPKYFGGIVAFSRGHFEAIDGFPNTFWGWGGEDDELEKRVRALGLAVDSPDKRLPNAVEDLEKLDLGAKLDLLRKTDWKCKVKWEIQEDYDKVRDQKSKSEESPLPPWWGLRGLDYEVMGTESLGEHATKISVDVKFNFNADGSEHWANRTLELDWKKKTKTTKKNGRRR